MTDRPPKPGWWQASDGNWYPPRDGDEPPAPGWWRASDGRWYPPRKDGQPPAPGWWLASNGRWYPPEKATRPVVAEDPEPSATKPKVVKKVAVKKVVAKKAVAKAPAAPEAAEQAAPTSAPAKAAAAKKAPAKKAPAKKAPAKKAAAKQSAPTPEVKTAATKAAPPAARPAAADAGLASSPESQIATRNKTSQQDAKLLAAARSKAAARAVGSLQAMIQAEMGDDAPATTDDPAPAASVAEPVDRGVPSVGKVASHKAASRDTTTGGADDGATIDRAPDTAGDGERPLMEIKPSAVATDLDRIGDRLLVFEDRVALHDRNGNVRDSIRGEQIADVVVTKRFTGHVLTIEAGDGTSIQAKGLRPDQAAEIRELIMRRTRRKGPAPERAGRREAAAPPTDAPAPADGGADLLPTEDLLMMLDALHDADILSAAELAEKRALVARLRRAPRLTGTTT